MPTYINAEKSLPEVEVITDLLMIQLPCCLSGMFGQNDGQLQQISSRIPNDVEAGRDHRFSMIEALYTADLASQKKKLAELEGKQKDQ